jgi:hypothetical protein
MRHAALLSLPLLLVLHGCDDAGSASAVVDDSVVPGDGDADAGTSDAGDGPTTTSDSGVPRDAGALADAAPITDSGTDSGAPRGDGGSSGAAGTGFASSFTRFAVPPSGLADGFFSSAYTLGARGWLVVEAFSRNDPEFGSELRNCRDQTAGCRPARGLCGRNPARADVAKAIDQDLHMGGQGAGSK